MPLPLAPVAAVALSYGTLAFATWAATRRIERGRRDQWAEDALDRLDEGLTLRREPEQLNATGRLKRVFRLGNGGAWELDASAIARVTLRKVDP
ncbi:MAG: hypothetical protein CSA74_05260 [Rhodobacterales bacterium]|nr:MAG: hypothetical protein CSA74_05260 [Rhodobacterales bacterium]